MELILIQDCQDRLKIGFVSFEHLRDWTGITRLIDQLASAMAARGHSVTIIARDGKASEKTPVSKRDYPHDLITLDLRNHGLREAREKIASSGLDICVTSIGSTQVLYMPWLFYGSGIPFILGEPADPRVFTFERWQPYEHYGALFSADAIQVLLEQYIPFYPDTLKPRITVIGNPAPPPAIVDLAARRAKETQTLIAVGRLNEEDKRFSYLLRAFAILREEFPAWRLKLVGDGAYWEYYHIMAEQLGIRKLVDFTGAVADPETHYNTADIFCLPSLRAEGLPMVLLEASAHALPLVGFSSCVASSALIVSDMGALIHIEPETDVIVALAEALRPLMAMQPDKRECIGIRARDSIGLKYGGDTVFDAWEDLITGTLEKTRSSGKTAMEVNSYMSGANTGIGPEWEGLDPDSPVWTQALMAGAAIEIAGRHDPLKPPSMEGSGLDPTGSGAHMPDADADTKSQDEYIGASKNSNPEIIRLRCELARMKADHDALERKYAALLTKFQTAAGKRKRNK